MLLLRQALGSELLGGIAAIFVAEPSYRAGWPDLTLTRGNEVKFVEVKTTDLLHVSQRAIIRAFAHPLRLDFSVVQVVIEGTRNQTVVGDIS